MRESTAWLHLVLAAPRPTSHLLEALDSAGGAAPLLSSDASLRAAGLSREVREALRQADPQRLAHCEAWLGIDGHHLVAWTDPRYPPLLRRLASPPLALFVAGDPDCLWTPQVAIVGSRNPTAAGLDHARDFAAEFARRGLTVTSGMAAGIDSAAHAAALDTGAPTIAVNGTGLDRVYPAGALRLAKRCERNGARVSEYPPGTPARRHHFPARNRIIAGLALGTLVIEAGLNSGSLITARLAAEAGREVFALPGSLHNPLVRGCHRLIKEGVRLAESAGDVMAALGPVASELAHELRGALSQEVEPLAQERPAPPAAWSEDPDYARLWDEIGHDPVSVDRLCERTGLGAGAVSSMLLLLELQGWIEPMPGGHVSRSARAPTDLGA